MKRVLFLVVVVVGSAVGFASCVMTPRDECHERLVADLGCCPLCETNCEASAELIEELCGEDFDRDADED